MSLSELVPGAIVGGDFRLLEPLRSGGMGAVYVVEQISTGKRRALKVMHPSVLSDASSRARFDQEARAGANIKSEHVVEVVAAGFDEALGIPWLVMELLVGRDLGEELRARERLGPALVLEIYEQLCHALSAAHKAQIVHRDLKPENIFLAESHRVGAEFVVKVLDFGIAKMVLEAQATNTGAIGTPLYMAPEQTVAGEMITPATDVWALGLIAFRLLTGAHFWKTARSKEPSSMMMLREVAIDPIPRASERAGELGLSAFLPEGFDAFFARCLDRDVSQRFRDAQELIFALRAVLGKSGDVSRFTSTQTRDGSEGGVDPTPPALEIDDLERTAGIPPRGGPSPRVWAVSAAAALGVVVVSAIGMSGAGPQKPSDSKAASPIRCPRDMAAIAGGRFTMGDLLKTVSVGAFCIDLDEVSVAEYDACVQAGACTGEGLACASDTKGAEDDPVSPARRPLSCVSRAQAMSFCAARGARLPTEEEWEWVARRGEEATAFPWGNEAPDGQLCWSGELVRSASCPLGAFSEGDTGQHVRDLAGNVSEWTSSEWSGKLVIRGSSWADDEASKVRSSARSFVGREHRHPQLGVRCARDSSLP